MKNDGSAPRGMTLLELLIALSIFTMFFFAISDLFVAGYQSYSQGEQKAFLFRGASIGFETAENDIRECEKIYMPNQALLQGGYSPVQGSNEPFIFAAFGASAEKETVGYTENNALHSFVRLLYSPDFDPSDSSTWEVEESQTLAQSVQGLKFTWSNPSGSNQFVLFNLTSYPESTYYPIESSIQLQGGF